MNSSSIAFNILFPPPAGAMLGKGRCRPAPAPRPAYHASPEPGARGGAGCIRCRRETHTAGSEGWPGSRPPPGPGAAAPASAARGWRSRRGRRRGQQRRPGAVWQWQPRDPAPTSKERRVQCRAQRPVQRGTSWLWLGPGGQGPGWAWAGGPYPVVRKRCRVIPCLRCVLADHHACKLPRAFAVVMCR